jgi:SlyX protein
MDDKTRITELEIQLAHASRMVDELSTIVADQANRLERAEKRIHMLMQRAAEAEAEAMSGIAVGDKPPPHW